MYAVKPRAISSFGCSSSGHRNPNNLETFYSKWPVISQAILTCKISRETSMCKNFSQQLVFSHWVFFLWLLFFFRKILWKYLLLIGLLLDLLLPLKSKKKWQMVSHSKLPILLFLVFSAVFQDPGSIYGVLHFQLHTLVNTDKKLIFNSIFTLYNYKE